MTDLSPATDRLGALVAAIADDELALPSACTGLSVADLLQHVDGLADAFAHAAAKDPLEGGPTADGDRLPADWRERIPARLALLARAWNEPGAWDGTTGVGGMTLPAAVAGAVAASELILHGWDLAVALGRPFDAEPELVALALTFVEPTATARPGGTPGLFGPVVPVPDGAPALDRLLGYSGRTPVPAGEGR